MANLNDQEKKWIDDLIAKRGLNEFGDPKDTQYMGGTPLFNEMTGRKIDRYDYILKNHPDWQPQAK